MPSFEKIILEDARSTPIKMTLDAAVVSCQLATSVKGGEITVNLPKTDIPAFTSNPVFVSESFGDKESPKSVIKLKTEDCKININQL